MLAVRPAVTLVVLIDTGYIRLKMGDDTCTDPCELLRASLVDTVRTLLARRYPFLEWQTTPSADTIELAWINAASAGILGSRLRFQFRGDGAVVETDRIAVDFESRDVFNARDDWSPGPLRRVWLATIPTTLASGDILPRVIGRVPIKWPVSFSPPPKRRANIKVHPDSLRAEPYQPPTFELRVHVLDSPDIDEDAVIPLNDCNVGTIGYSCEIKVLQFARYAIQENNRLDALFNAPGTVTPKLTRVTTFVPGRSRIVLP